MSSQGLFGAIEQYWSVNEAPRLNRRNTFFEDHPKVSNYSALRIGLIVSIIATAMVVFWCIGVIL